MGSMGTVLVLPFSKDEAAEPSPCLLSILDHDLKKVDNCTYPTCKSFRHMEYFFAEKLFVSPKA